MPLPVFTKMYRKLVISNGCSPVYLVLNLNKKHIDILKKLGS
jgi:hypothetical protein